MSFLLDAAVILLDLLLAILIALGVVVATAFFVSLFASLQAGSSPIDVVSYIESVRASPANPEHYWIYAMMIWTLVPTIVHSVAYSGALVMSALSPLKLADCVAWMIDKMPAALRLIPALVLTIVRTAPIVLLMHIVKEAYDWQATWTGWYWPAVIEALAAAALEAAHSAQLAATLLAAG